MTRGNPGRHAARHRAERPARPARTLPFKAPDAGRVAVVAAPLATVAVVGAGVALTPGGTHHDTLADLHAATHAQVAAQAHARAVAARSTSAVSSSAIDAGARSAAISRDLDRLDPIVTGHEWATADLNVYAGPTDSAGRLPEISGGDRVATTGTTSGAFTEVVAQGRAAWVHTAYLADKKPTDPATMGLVYKPCAATASVEQGLVPNAIHAWEAICNAFPQVRTFLGLGARDEHNTGHAIDVMVYGDSTLGYQIAQFVQAHAAQFDLYDLIYRQHIWTPVRASEGWRLMPDRGSPTANHMDHVHVGVN